MLSAIMLISLKDAQEPLIFDQIDEAVILPASE